MEELQTRILSQDGSNIEYKDFWCKIDTVNNHSGEDIDNDLYSEFMNADQLRLQSQTKCDDYSCEYLLSRFDNASFTSFVEEELIDYFSQSVNAETETLQFTVLSVSEYRRMLSTANILNRGNGIMYRIYITFIAFWVVLHY